MIYLADIHVVPPSENIDLCRNHRVGPLAPHKTPAEDAACAAPNRRAADIILVEQNKHGRDHQTTPEGPNRFVPALIAGGFALDVLSGLR